VPIINPENAQFACRLCGRFNELLDYSVAIGADNAGAGVRDLVAAENRCRPAVKMHAQHGSKVGSS
jgi:hypothetical protein